MSMTTREPRHLPARPETPPEAKISGVRDQLVTALMAIPTAWLLLATWLLHYPSDHAMNVAQVNDTFCGIVLACTVLIRLSKARGPGSDAIVFVIGAWVAMSPYVLDYGTTPVTHNARMSDLVVGICLMVLATVSYGLREAAARAARRHTG